ncbi:MAG: FAD-dependent oxidoreductase, partial [Bacteroidota bacterium]
MPLLPPTLSYWESESFFKHLDLLVIGGGIVGLHAALRARELAPSARIVVAERSPFPAGASTRNAGFACFGSMTELLDDLRQQDEDQVWSLVELRWRGLLGLRQLLGDSNLSYRPWGGWEMFGPQDQSSYLQCLDQLEPFNQIMAGITGEKRTFVEADEHISEQGLAATEHLLLNRAEGQIHTGEMMKSLLSLVKENGIEVWGGMEISQIEPDQQGVKLQVRAGWE